METQETQNDQVKTLLKKKKLEDSLLQISKLTKRFSNQVSMVVA